MQTDDIKEIIIDESERLLIYPSNEKFTMIWRSATEVHWDVEDSFLYSPKPREWSYLDWFKHIITVIKNEANCQLILTENTLWVNIPTGLKEEMANWIAGQ